MKINLSDHIDSLTGSLGRGFGYHIQRRKNGFFAKRNSKGVVPRDGHCRLIVACADINPAKKIGAIESCESIHLVPFTLQNP